MEVTIELATHKRLPYKVQSGVHTQTVIQELIKEHKLLDVEYFFFNRTSNMRSWSLAETNLSEFCQAADVSLFPSNCFFYLYQVLELVKRNRLVTVTQIGPSVRTRLQTLLDLSQPLSQFVALTCKKHQVKRTRMEK